MTRRRRPTPLGAGLRSSLLPGWGQLSVGWRRTGWALIFLSLSVTVMVASGVFVLSPVELLTIATDPHALLLLVAANAVFGAARIVCAGHAWRVTGGRSRLAAMVLVLVTMFPHVAVGWVGLEARDTLIEVFEEPSGPPELIVASDTTTTSTLTETTTTTAASTPISERGAVAASVLTPSEIPPSTGTTPTTAPALLGGERLNLLLLGADAGPGRRGSRTDSMIVVSVDPRTGETALFGLPRNYAGFGFSDGTPYPGGILNTVYQWGLRNPERFGSVDPGASAIKDVAEVITGLEIDHFVLVDLTGFAELVDAFGGVTLEVPAALDAPLYDPETGGYRMIRIPEGIQQLDGDEALAYSRARYGSSDYARMGRQRCVLSAMAERASPLSLMARLPVLFEVIEENVTTDLPLDLLPELIQLMPTVAASEIRMIGFDFSWRSGVTEDGYAIPDVQRIRSAVQVALEGTNSEEETEISTAEEACTSD